MTDTKPQVGDSRPDEDILDQDPRDLRIAVLEERLAKAAPPAQLRDFAERMQQRNAELEPLQVENDALRVQLGLAHAGVDPESLLGQTVATAAVADGVTDPAQVSALARTLRAEAIGGPSRREE